MLSNESHPPIKFGKTGALVINLGTPDSTNWFDIRKYLKEFLSDKRVIEVNPIVWKLILNLFILQSYFIRFDTGLYFINLFLFLLT